MSLPNISTLEIDMTTDTTPIDTTVHESFDWDFETGDFVLVDGKLKGLTGKDYLKVWAQKILRTVRNSLMYENYGSYHHNYIGKVFDREFLQSELERTVKEALLTNPAITSVSDFTYEIDGELVNISLTANSIYGEVTI